MGDHAELVSQRLAWLDEPHQERVRRHRRRGLLTASLLLTLVMAVVVLDGLDVVDSVGVDDGRRRASAAGTTLEVRYPVIARPALAAPFEIVVRRDGGFEGQPIEVAVDADYLLLWDLNGLFPSPAEETATAEEIHWTFDPPDGDVLRILYEARIEPATQHGRSGHVTVLDDGTPVVTVDFETRVRP